MAVEALRELAPLCACGLEGFREELRACLDQDESDPSLEEITDIQRRILFETKQRVQEVRARAGGSYF